MRELSRHNLAELCDRPDLLSKHLTKDSKLRGSLSLSEEQLLESLSDIQACLRRANAVPFLMFGSLLGPVRDQRFIPGDGDLDLGVLGSADFRKAVVAIGQSGLFKTLYTRNMNGAAVIVRFEHINGTAIDLKSFVREASGGVSWYVVSQRYGLKKHYPHSFELEEFDFKGLSCFIPKDAEQFLAWQYGDWQTPDRNYSMLTSGPINSEAHFRWVDMRAPFELICHLHRGRKKAFIADARNLATLLPEDELWQKLQAVVTKIELSKSPN